MALSTCSFCGKNKNSVRHIVEGPKVSICDECAVYCLEIMLGEQHSATQKWIGEQPNATQKWVKDRELGQITGSRHNHAKPRYRLKEAFDLLGLAHSVGYLRIKDGSLLTVKDGRRTFILADEIDRYVASGDPGPAASPPKDVETP